MAVIKSLSLYASHNVAIGRPTHYARNAATAAEKNGHVSRTEVADAQAVHRRANVVKHEWHRDPLVDCDPWAEWRKFHVPPQQDQPCRKNAIGPFEAAWGDVRRRVADSEAQIRQLVESVATLAPVCLTMLTRESQMKLQTIAVHTGGERAEMEVATATPESQAPLQSAAVQTDAMHSGAVVATQTDESQKQCQTVASQTENHFGLQKVLQSVAAQTDEITKQVVGDLLPNALAEPAAVASQSNEPPKSTTDTSEPLKEDTATHAESLDEPAEATSFDDEMSADIGFLPPSSSFERPLRDELTHKENVALAMEWLQDPSFEVISPPCGADCREHFSEQAAKSEEVIAEMSHLLVSSMRAVAAELDPTEDDDTEHKFRKGCPSTLALASASCWISPISKKHPVCPAVRRLSRHPRLP